MAKAIARRGPDDEGVVVESNGLTFAHRRLSIVDISPTGHQPMTSASGRYLIAFNGEIYNFVAIRKELETSGVTYWRGHSDTEVLLNAIEAWGFQTAIKRIAGMFAFALWDRNQSVLRLVRDRLGEKPLYYGWQRNTLLFGSDLAAFASNPDFEGRIRREALVSLLRNGNVSAPLSIFEGIDKLPPGCYWEIDAEGFDRRLSPKPVPYWSYVQTAESSLGAVGYRDVAEATEDIEQILRRSVAQQLVADVPVGAFLSGGIDSSVVVALAQSVSKSAVNTFTIGFEEALYNEANDARLVAKHLGTNHTEMIVSDRDARDLIPSLPTAYSEPFADSSQIPTMLVSRLARQKVTVALSGDGGDEVFGGYNRYLAAEQLWSRIAPIPVSMRKLAARALLSVPPDRLEGFYGGVAKLLPKAFRFRGFGDKVHKFADAMHAQTPRDLYSIVSTLTARDSGLLLGGPGAAFTAESDADSAWPPNNPIHAYVPWMMAQDAVHYLPDDILVKVDRAAMFYSLETRVPMLDHELIEAAWRIPQSMKISGGEGKQILRAILYKYVPKSLIERPKMGFGVPLDIWLRGPLREWADSLLSKDRLDQDGYFNSAKVSQMWLEHQSGRRNRQHHLWPILIFQQWKASRAL